MRGLLILIIVLVIALLAGDRIAVAMAQNEIGRKIAAEYHLPNEPRVDIGGFPFLTQAVDGTYRDVRVHADTWTGQGLTVTDLNVTMTDVSAPLTDILNNRTSNLVAATATATAVVPYDTVRGFAPTEVDSISYAPDGLRITGTFSVEGIPIPAAVIVTVAPTDNGIEVTPISAQPATGGLTIPLALLRQSLTFTIPLQRLPLGARLTAIQPTPAGLHVTAQAQNAHLTDLP
ncbi:DUF2993 domain-containing protein [Nocardia sp. NPDC049149]|uniref:LmeA family phospholipid-binding protein n=1 Tax=Nocardia sp. NPDC049149 TaxID=3364315 RepID=UPI0037172853